jgi:DNA repair ATPase RecN
MKHAMKTYNQTALIPVSDWIHLNRLQQKMVDWAAFHTHDAFFQTFFQNWREVNERLYQQLADFSTLSAEPKELNALKGEWQGLLNMAAVRTKGMRTSDFFAMADKLFAVEEALLKRLLKLLQLNANLKAVAETHLREITLLREAMTYLEQYDAVFEGAKVAVMASEIERRA